MLFDSEEYKQKIISTFEKYNMSGFNLSFSKEKGKDRYYLVEFNDLEYVDDPKREYICFMIKRNEFLISNAASKMFNKKVLLDLAGEVLLGSGQAEISETKK